MSHSGALPDLPGCLDAARCQKTTRRQPATDTRDAGPGRIGHSRLFSSTQGRLHLGRRRFSNPEPLDQCTGRPAAPMADHSILRLLAAHLHDAVARVAHMGNECRRLPGDKRAHAYCGIADSLGDIEAAEDSRRISRGAFLRTSSRQRGVGGLDHPAEESRGDALFPAQHPLLPGDRPGPIRPGLRRWYVLSLLAFALAMLGKGLVAPLPVVLLGITWWHRRIVASDCIRISPFFAVAATLTSVNIWFQSHSYVHSRSAGFVERMLGAAAALWSYAGKAIWAANL